MAGFFQVDIELPFRFAPALPDGPKLLRCWRARVLCRNPCRLGGLVFLLFAHMKIVPSSPLLR
ncbi:MULTISPECIES: hypothetical protein [Paenarthrobacter]|nr:MULTISPECIES: hypothetical protein [Paenarthrobacter]MDD7836212.1 hypothetical protein [Paenarthrobacter sp. AB444]MDP9935468.1 hypothetical protein [Paenarthrobacter nicotinovorans]